MRRAWQAIAGIAAVGLLGASPAAGAVVDVPVSFQVRNLNRMQVCVGSWADVAHQVVSALRGGGYEVAGRPARRFQRVALASYCLGGLIAQVEAYSFKDVDAFVGLSSAFDQGFSRGAATDLFTNPRGPTLVCARGGERKEPAGPGS